MTESTAELARLTGALTLPGQVTPTALLLPEGLSYDQWEQVGQTFEKIEAGIHWWRGDWLLYGERRYGETYAQALDPVKGRYRTLQNEVWVAGKIEPLRRLNSLSWSHHQAVASLEPAQQDGFLARAAEMGWTRRELKRQIRDWKIAAGELFNRLNTPDPNDEPEEEAEPELEGLGLEFEPGTPEPETEPELPRRRVPLSIAEEREIYERVKAGETYASVAADCKVDEERIGTIVRQFRAAEWVPDPVVAAIALPLQQVWRCIVIDPPWPMEKIEREERPDQGRTLDYPTMPVPDMVAATPVDKLADPDGCHVYLWTTHRFLPNAFWLFSRWGVRYQCLMTWVKPTGMTPYSWMYDTEHVLFGTYGQGLPLERMGLKLSFEAPVVRGTHSKKPDVFYERVVAASPGPRLEMFARAERDGFEVWGNEVPK